MTKISELPPRSHSKLFDGMPASRYLAYVILLCASAANASIDEPMLGQSAEYSAGPYSFQASPISFRGRSLGYAETGYKFQKFSKYWVYQACVLSQDEPSTGNCHDWKVLDGESNRLTNIKLPGFDAFWSDPAFSWPYIAYVKVGKLDKGPWEQDAFCIVFNYKTKHVVQRKKIRVSASHFETDFPGLFPPPLVAQDRGANQFTFRLVSGEGSEVICEISVP